MSYSIIKQIGEGTYSKVYHIQYNDKDYAMKKINLSGITSNQKKYILSELKIVSGHNSNFIIKFYNAFIQEDNLCIVMEYCSKGTLENHIKNKKLTNETIWKYFSQLCGGVSYLHANNIIHRDLKSTNILIDSNDNIKLIDFGVSKILNNYMKFTKSFVGTPYCMSPEILKNVFYDHKVDIWALGIILYQMTHNGKIPFSCKNFDQLRDKINRCKFEIDLSVNGSFKVIIQKCIQSSPHKRIKLDVLIKHSEIKKHIPNKNVIKKINQIEKIPNYEDEWKAIVKKIPNNLPILSSDTEKNKHQTNLDFMEHYSKDNLIHLNTRLIDTVVEKNIIIAQLQKQISDLKKFNMNPEKKISN